MGSTPSGYVNADTLIDIEREDSPQKVSVDYSERKLQLRQDGWIQVMGTYADGSSLDLTESTQTTFESSVAGVVTVGRYGQITALSPGSPTIVVRHREKQALVKVVVIGDRR